MSDVIGNSDLRQAWEAYLGLPSTLLKKHVGGLVNGKALDAYGHVLGNAMLAGDNWRKRHDDVKWAIYGLARIAQMDVTCEVFGLFAAYLNQQGLDQKTRQGLVADFKFNIPGKPEFLAELKCINHGPSFFDHLSVKERNGGVARRASKINSEYRAKCRTADVKYNEFVSVAGSKGPMECRLEGFGRVHALVVGPRGEGSTDLHALLRLIAKTAADKSWRGLGAESPEDAKAVYLARVYRSIGITGVRANARLLHERLGVWRSGNGKKATETREAARSAYEAAKGEYRSSFAAFDRQVG